jgi:exopolysaccharide biosynthesis protein
MFPRRKASQFFLRGFFFLYIFILLSCATQIAAGFETEIPVVFQNVDAVTSAWQPPVNGISDLAGKISNPQLEFWAIRIDLTSPGVKIFVGGGAANESPTLSTKVSSFVRDNNLIAGINAAPFDVSTSREGQPIKNLGLVVSDGTVISPANRSLDALVFYKDGRAAIVRQVSIRSTDDIQNAICGFYQILTDGEPAGRTLNNEDRHPRSAAGLSDNGKTLYLLVVDGRRARSVGSTEKETAQIMLALGAHEAINFDGGGSTSLAMRYSDGSIKVINSPVHGGTIGQERAVAGCIGFSLSRER